MNKSRELIGFLALLMVGAPSRAQPSLVTLLESGDPSPSAVPGSATYRWDCNLAPCRPFNIAAVDEFDRTLVVGKTLRSIPPFVVLERDKVVVLDLSGNQTLIAESGMPSRDGFIHSIFDASFGPGQCVSFLHYWRLNSGSDSVTEISLLANGELLPLVVPGMPLLDGTTLPTDAEGFHISSYKASPIRGAFIGGPGNSSSSLPVSLYAVDEAGVNRIFTSGEVDKAGLPIGEPKDLVVSQNGLVVCRSIGPAGHQFVVYDGQEIRVLHRFGDLNASNPDLELLSIDNLIGQYDVSSDGRVCAIVGSRQNGVVAERLIEFSDLPPSVVYEPGIPAEGGGTVQQINRVRYSRDNRIVAHITRSTPLAYQQIIVFRSGGAPHLAIQSNTDYPGFRTLGFEPFFAVGTSDSFSVLSHASGEYQIDFVSGLLPSCPADTNHDGVLTPSDFSSWIAAFNSQSPDCDQNGDGLCAPSDFSAWIQNYNAGC